MVAPGRGILAADESSGIIKKRFDALGVVSTADNRRDYREDGHAQRCEIFVWPM
jgi:fructose-bisphosphate aldolase, class I